MMYYLYIYRKGCTFVFFRRSFFDTLYFCMLISSIKKYKLLISKVL